MHVVEGPQQPDLDPGHENDEGAFGPEEEDNFSGRWPQVVGIERNLELELIEFWCQFSLST